MSLHCHEQLYDKETNTYNCKICGKKFATKTDILEHRLTHEGEFTCEVCNEVQTSAFDYSAHLKGHRTDGKYPCPVCDFATSFKGAIVKHIREPHLKTRARNKMILDADTVPCIVCKRKYSTANDLLLHQRIFHMVTFTDAAGKNQCYICRRIFSGRGALWNHMRTHQENVTKEKNFVCEVCDKRFNKKYHLECHMVTHTKAKPYKCDGCEKRFGTTQSLLLHKRTHTGEKPYTCHICNKSFLAKTHLTNHVRVHTGEKLFKCSYCQKCLASQPSLAEHIRSHTGEKPYSCDYCERRFARLPALKIHLRSHTGDKPYKCSYCHRTFTGRSNLVSHEKRHKGEKSYCCDHCGKSFQYEVTFQAHMKLHTGERFYCYHCNEGFIYKAMLTDHVMVCQDNKAKQIIKKRRPDKKARL
ncbi:zinc finger and scan domain-containing [Holotrichia oblita]|uniref:Zinc finger and scan domain-containing n=1 Tax=Holotrichia oblita TaxID=644536 RepID=A0ACB9TXL7_HOLOL|nr:zinc finger and scan domain-containing [Holotrichia oblita]